MPTFRNGFAANAAIKRINAILRAYMKAHADDR